MRSFEESVNILLGLIALDSPSCLALPITEHLHESASVYAIISRLVDGNIESAFKIYTHNGEAVQNVICNHLRYISNNGYEKYRLNLSKFFS